MTSSIGKIFTVTSFGESHGYCIGAVIDGCPAGIEIVGSDIQKELDRRRPSTASSSTTRAEADQVEILSGLFMGKTTGAPITMLIRNKDSDSNVYEKNRLTPRPGHADYAAYLKYGSFNDYRGGGRFSGRITAGFVMAGAVAKKLLAMNGIEILAHTIQIGSIHAMPATIEDIRMNTESSPVRCADTRSSRLMEAGIDLARQDGDSLGGIIEAVALNVPAGLGEPVFDTLEGELAKALFAIPAVKGVEFGAGFAAAAKKGSENNDTFTIEEGKVVTTSNYAGGVLGGISNGMPVVLRVAVKPTPSIAKPQQSVDLETMMETTIAIKGRHDACIVPRAVPVVESMVAITLADLALRAGIITGVVK